MKKSVKKNLILIFICVLFIFLMVIICKQQTKSPKEFVSKDNVYNQESNENIDIEKSGDLSGDSNEKIKYDIIEYDDSIMFSGYNNTAIMYNFDEQGIFSGVEYIAFCDNEDVVLYLIEQYKSQVGNGIIEDVSGEGEIFTMKYELEYFSDFIGKTKAEVKEVLTSDDFIIKGE